MYEPVYISTFEKGLFEEKIEKARNILKKCTLCPRQCKVNRLAGETGVCGTGEKAYVASYHPHFGEEPPLSGWKGSGTIFFARCNLLCNFCQNYDISHLGLGSMVSGDNIARIMIELQQSGCHNINFVTPSHVALQILSAVKKAVDLGLKIPIVYNTSGYDMVETLELLEGVIDIYMPDFKFWSSDVAKMTCNAPDYPETARRAIIEMHRQVGNLVLDKKKIAVHGLLIRHLVLPDKLAGTREIMEFISKKISPDTYVNIMSQYRPCGKAAEIKSLSRFLSKNEYFDALREALEQGIKLDQE